MNAFLMHARIALRSWRRTPLLAATAIATLSLGLGVATAVFSVASGSMFNVVPWKQRDRATAIASIRLNQGNQPQPTAPGVFLDWSGAQLRSFEGITAAQYASVNLTDAGEGGSVVVGPRVSPNALSLLGVPLHLGRGFGADDAAPGARPVAIVSHGLWQRRYGANPGIVGSTIEIDGAPVTVVGVLGAGQFYPFPGAELIVPLRLEPGASRSERTLEVVGLLRAGTTMAQAQAELDVLARNLEAQYPASDAGWTVRVMTLAERFSGGTARIAVALMLVAVGLLLLVVCANVANLLLARSAGRVKESATRSAIGATRAQLAAQLVLEAGVIAAFALPLSLVTGRLAIELLLTFVPSSASWMEQVLRFDAPVVLSSAASSAIALLVFSIAPALQGSRVDLQRVLKEGGGRGATSARPWIRQGLAVLQLGLAISLLASALLIAQRFHRIQERDPGIDVEGIYATALQLPAARYSEDAHWRRFQEDLLDGLARTPGVDAVASVNFPPFGRFSGLRTFGVEGKPLGPNEETPTALWANVSPDYFRALGIDLLRGRELGPEDRDGGVAVAVINRALASRQFGSDDPIGRRIDIEGDVREIVGVVSDYYNAGLREAPRPQIFVPFAQRPGAEIGVVIRSSRPLAALSGQFRSILRQVDPTLSIPDLQSMRTRLDENLWNARFLQRVMVLLTAVALFLAALGVYAVLSYSTTQRAHEFAIRIALGASPSRIAMLVLRQAGGLTLAGTLVAVVLTVAQWPFLRSAFDEGGGPDPAQFLMIAVLMALVGLGAAAHPTLRVIRTDPMNALRGE